jgi:deazaflavin-dependent oxidoreductase (nitroreductase family)
MQQKITPRGQGLPVVFRAVNQMVVLAYRLGQGRWLASFPQVVPQVMILTHTGRKTGLKHKTPVAYAVVDGEVYCVVSTGEKTHWLRNLEANPQVEVWLPDGWWNGVAEEVTDPALRTPLMRHVMAASGLPARLLGIHPRTTGDVELDRKTAAFRLFRIRRSEPCTGRGGPGDLAWVWPLVILYLLSRTSRRRRKKR